MLTFPDKRTCPTCRGFRFSERRLLIPALGSNYSAPERIRWACPDCRGAGFIRTEATP